MRDAASPAVDVKTELALRVLGREVDFTGWRIETFGDHDEMMNQFLHLRHHVRFWRRHVLPVGHIDRTTWQSLDYLAQNFHALPHLFDPHQITIVAIAR